MTRTKSFRMHTSEEFSWIAEKNLENAVHFYLPELIKIDAGQHPYNPTPLLSASETKLLKDLGVIKHHNSGGKLKRLHLTDRAKTLMGSLTASMPNP